jgi:hypothetical protein
MKSAKSVFANSTRWRVRLRRPRDWFGRQHPAASLIHDGAATADPLLEFSIERQPNGIGGARHDIPHGRARRWVVGGLATAGVVAVGIAVVPPLLVASRAATPQLGKLSVDSRPSGTQIFVDGVRAGVTPLSVALTPGQHSMVLRRGADQKTVPLTIVRGVELSQYFEFAPVAAAPSSGNLAVTTDPAAARIRVDGHPSGTAPILVPDLPPGEHTVSVATDAGWIERKVNIEAGTTASVAFSLPRTAAPDAGWVSVSAPFDVQVFQDNELVGSNAVSKIMMSAGRHDIRLVSKSLGYDDTRHVTVTGGKAVAIRIDPPHATVSVNAKPWADVIVDGAAVGQTPLSNLIIGIGTHEVVFRHPKLGERRETVVVALNRANRISADLTK